MSEFKEFKGKMQKKFQQLVKNNEILYLTDVDKDLVWETYLDSFPEGTNEVYRERRAYDCNHCRQFIRPYANIVAIVNNELVSIWDIKVDGYYQEVADGLAKLVKSKPIKNVFVTKFAQLGVDFNHQEADTGPIIRWDHFYFKLPVHFVDKSGDSVEAKQGQYRDSKNVFRRSLDEIILPAIETTLELIEQNSLYRGAEHKGVIELFLKYKKEYDILPENVKDNYCWVNSIKAIAVARIRNNAIGTLLIDISEGKALDHAVSAFERIMAPSNYKRPNAVITKRMIEEAQNKIKELGFEDSLGRRYAVKEDITINNVLFANRDAKKAMNVFEELVNEVKTDPKKFNKVEAVSIRDFIKDILPKVDSLEVMLENKHSGNLMSLIAPQDKDAKSMLKWNNNFSWAYNGDMTDSIKERVKAAGGKVEGELRCSLSWFNYDDLDIHVVEPNGNRISFNRKHSVTSGQLDVDMNAGGRNSKTPVENIIWTDKSKMREGTYKLIVNNYSKRDTIDVGFDAEIEHNGEIHSFHYAKAVGDGRNVNVAEFVYSKISGIKIIKALPSTTSSKEVWGLNTNSFQKVSMVLNSPNHWDEQVTGNKHCFFILEGCKNDGTPRGFFNEFLKEDLLKQKRVFEALGSKMKVDVSGDQMSGLGFSSTQKNSVVCKVKGAFTRTVKINF